MPCEKRRFGYVSEKPGLKNRKSSNKDGEKVPCSVADEPDQLRNSLLVRIEGKRVDVVMKVASLAKKKNKNCFRTS